MTKKRQIRPLHFGHKGISHYRLIFISVEYEVNIFSKIRRGTIQANLPEDCTEHFPEPGKTTRRETPLCSVISHEENRQPVAMTTPAN